MRILILASLCLLIPGAILSAQANKATLQAQSPDGKTVKLIWVLNKGDNHITGFDVKRKDDLGSWQKLNKAPILPQISTKNSLANVETDKAEASRVKAKLFQLLTASKLKETSHAVYLQKLEHPDKEMLNLNALIGKDYDVALLCGFAYVDHTVTTKTDYEYGLFLEGTDTLLAETTWNYGEIPDLNVVTEMTAKGAAKAKGIHIIWTADVKKMRSADVAGFNIYRQGIRLNQTPITSSNSADPSEFSWYDASANTHNLSKYSISAESIFGIEGIIQSYTYNPADHPAEYIPAQTNEVLSLGFYLKDGMDIRWAFPAEYERFIKGFHVEKNELPGGYKRVSDLLPPGTRSFADHSSSSVSSYIAVRVITEYKDKTFVTGPGRLYSYFPIREPPMPQNLKGKCLQEDKKAVVKLSWEPALNGDTITNYYKVYTEDVLNDRFFAVTEKQPIRGTTYLYSPAPGKASVCRFYITAVSRTDEESPASDTVSVLLPAMELPAPVIKRAAPEGGNAIINWDYNDMPALKGFRLYEDKNLIAGENDLKKDAREFRTKTLTAGTTYEYTLVAVSENNVESAVSMPARVTMPAETKKKKK